MKAISISSGLKNWLETTSDASILHFFDEACNLQNDRGEILSIVSKEVGNGPFNLVVEADKCLEKIHLDDKVSIQPDSIQIGDENISLMDIKEWDPTPNWRRIRQKQFLLRNYSNLIINLIQMAGIEEGIGTVFFGTGEDGVFAKQFGERAKEGILVLTKGLVNQDEAVTMEGAGLLAGLGPGLTPSGDDFLVGTLHGVWGLFDKNEAPVISTWVVAGTGGMTGNLSRAWIEAAGRGEAGEPWHELFEAIWQEDQMWTMSAARRILATGETSGADALSGFLNMVQVWMDLQEEE